MELYLSHTVITDLSNTSDRGGQLWSVG